MVKSTWFLVIVIGFVSGLSCAKPLTGISNQLDLCSIRSGNANSIANTIIKEEQHITIASMASSDCVFEIINKLASAPSANTLHALDIIASKSDGDIGEALMDVSVKLLEKDTPGFIDHLAKNPNSALFNTLVDGLSMQLKMENTDRESLKAHFSSKLATDLHKQTLNAIFEKLDPKKFD